MHCPVAVMHFYFEKSHNGNIQLIKDSSAIGKIFDNTGYREYLRCGFQDVHHSTAEDFLFYMDHLQSPYLSVCFDTGHVIKSSTAVLRICLLEYKKQ